MLRHLKWLAEQTGDKAQHFYSFAGTRPTHCCLLPFLLWVRILDEGEKHLDATVFPFG